MTTVEVRELAAWGLDPNEHRPANLAPRPAEFHDVPTYPPLASEAHDALRSKLGLHQNRPDLHHEMQCLDWHLDVIDLRALLTFQRRLHFDSRWDSRTNPPPRNDADLLALCLAQPQAPAYTIDPTNLTLTSTNPNLQITLTNQQLAITTGSPFLEVAEYNHRWFLRDGYHRAYTLLRQGIHSVPAVVIHARTLAELNANKPHFFPPSTLFSPRPPHLLDFLNDHLTLNYTRPALLKTITLNPQETFTPGDLP